MGEWSKPVSLRNDQLHDQAIRGRLLIVRGMEPAYGGPPTTNGAMTFVELQNVTGGCCDDIDVCFDVMKVNCELSDSAGKTANEGAAAQQTRCSAPGNDALVDSRGLAAPGR
jgi:hypothetical protein